MHGFFIFDERRPGDASDFISLFGLNLERDRAGRLTFEKLAAAPEFSLAGLSYLGTPAIATFAGQPWEVMRENKIVYNFATGLMSPIASITQVAPIEKAGRYYVSPGLILPGSLMDSGDRVTDYAAWFSTDTSKFIYSEVSVE